MNGANQDSGNAGHLLRRAIEFHQAGDLPSAQSLYGQILSGNPDHLDALHLFGVLRHQQGHNAEALGLIVAAHRVDPTSIGVLSNLAVVLQALGRHEDAVAAYDQAIRLQPDHFESHCGRGLAQHRRRNLDAALASYGDAVALRPEDLHARLQRGVVLSELGRHQEALGVYDEVLAKAPDHIAALNNRGAALQELGRDEEAAATFARALALAPDDPELHANRGAALQRAQRFEEALACFDRALAIRPDDAGTLDHRGNALLALRRYGEALKSYDRALAIAPDNARAFCHRGVALNEIKLHEEALASLDRAIALDPSYADAHYNHGNAFKGMRQIAPALESYEKALALGASMAFGGYAECAAKMCDWHRTAQVQAAIESHVVGDKSIVPPFTLLTYDTTPALQLACARTYAAGKFSALAAALHGGTRRHHDKLRIAYLSADFNRHATSYLMASLFERHDRSRFEITGISFGADDGSETRDRVVAAFDTFRDVRDLDDRAVAKLMRECEIDIAVDLKGYTLDARPAILWHRPAPIQVSYLGYPGTMGVDFIDYLVADAVVVPPGEERFYAEKIVRLPDCYQVNDPRRAISEPMPTRHEAGLPAQGFVFCSFNNNYKITSAMFDIWMRLLTAIDGSVLWLLRDDNAADNLRHAAAERGVDPARLVFAARAEQPDHLARHRLADLFLDTLPVNAHTTCSDALWAGLPVLTCRGNAFAGRVAASLLQSVGLPELITSNLADYEAMALRLAQNPALLGHIRTRLAENRLIRPLFDIELSRRHIEAAYTAMWERWQRGETPKSFDVARGPSDVPAPPHL
jgi:protein O-GlcNAc transferase